MRSAPVPLTIGKRYELSAWVRTENLTVRDTGRSPIATGAALSMASMPFDVHSESLAGTRPWTRLSLKFTASRAHDAILLAIANGGAFHGKAWFEGVSLDEASTRDAWPAREAVKTFGPAYRYPAAGWIYLHIEGKPYERGYQHGYLMAREIPEYLERCAAELGTNAAGWSGLRTQAGALFLRGFDREILEEMRGIADGASDAGVKWQNRRLDVVALVVANITVELGELRSAMTVTPTGLETLKFSPPTYYDQKRDSVLDRCSAFAATGPATRDGKMVIGHVTWWPLTLAEQTNVWIDVKPENTLQDAHSIVPAAGRWHLHPSWGGPPGPRPTPPSACWHPSKMLTPLFRLRNDGVPCGSGSARPSSSVAPSGCLLQGRPSIIIAGRASVQTIRRGGPSGFAGIRAADFAICRNSGLNANQLRRAKPIRSRPT